MEMIIRKVSPEDLDRVTEVEAECFPTAEAAGREALKQRIETFPENFFVAEKDRTVIGFINGCVTDERTICDEMYEDSRFHHPEGSFQSIFGLDVIPEQRRQGVAEQLMRKMIEEARVQGKKGLILTCKSRLIHYYEKFGYVNCGVSKSVHGNAVWYDMILEF